MLFCVDEEGGLDEAEYCFGVDYDTALEVGGRGSALFVAEEVEDALVVVWA